MGNLFLTKEAKIYKEAKTAPSINGAGKTGHLHEKDETRILPNSTHKDKLKIYIFELHYIKFRIKDPNVRPESIKLLEENIEHSMT